MKIIQEGEKGVALAPELGRVPVVYEYRDLTLDSGATVRSVLVGVHEESGDVLVVPGEVVGGTVVVATGRSGSSAGAVRGGSWASAPLHAAVATATTIHMAIRVCIVI